MTTIDPQKELERLQKVYAGMVDGELVQLGEAAAELTDEARSALKAEMERRGLAFHYDESPRCPNCQSLDIQFEGVDPGLGLATGWAIGVPVPLRSDTWKCNSCGHQ